MSNVDRIEAAATQIEIAAGRAFSGSSRELVDLEFGASSASPAFCGSVRREVALQYRFMVLYQILVGALSVLTLVMLLYAVVQVVVGQSTFQAILSGAAAVVSGAAAGFLLKQRADSRVQYKGALLALKRSSC